MIRPRMAASTTCSTTAPEASRWTNATAHRNSAPRRSSGTSCSWSSNNVLLRSSDRGCPDHRADSTPGIPFRASTQSPLSSATVGRPVIRWPAHALRRALPSKSGWSSTGSAYSTTSSRPSTSTSGSVAPRIRCISASFLALREARNTVGLEARSARTSTTGGQCFLLQPGEVGTPLLRQREQRVELGAVEGCSFGGALHLDEPAVTGHHDVHVGLGPHVLLVGQVEAGRTVDDADGHGGDRADQGVAG